MSEIFGPNQELFVILKKPQDPTSLFTMDLGDGRLAICVFSHRAQAMLFAMNAQGLDATGVTPIADVKLRAELEVGKQNGATHVLLDPSAGAGTTDAVEIDTFAARIGGPSSRS